MVTVAAFPVVVIAWSILDPDTAMWSNLWQTRLPGMIVDTTTLLVTVVPATVLLGCALAWLVTAHEFPGRRVLGWLMVVPLAIPGYVSGFVWLDTLSGPLGARGVRSIWVCAAVLTLSLYPYVYLFARAAFASQSADVVAAARSLGCTPAAAFRRVVLPACRPAIAAGAALVAMEVLTDIGTVRLYNVSTLADGVLRVWFGTGDRQAAAELAVLLIGIAATLVICERALRGGGRAATTPAAARLAPRPLPVTGRVIACVGALAVLGIAVVAPLAKLVGWAADAADAGDTATVAGGIGHHLWHTVSIAAAATLACLVVGTALAVVAGRHGRPGRLAAGIATAGYAVPGPVVAVGAVICLAWLDRTGLVPGGAVMVGSFVGVVYALVVRFLAVGYHGIEAALGKVPPHAVASARTLGAGRFRIAWKVELPVARAGLLAAAALVTIDTVKELPITLLLRPFGVDTLSVWVWQATSEGLWRQAALPSLVMVGIGMAAVAVLMTAMRAGAEMVS
jgi:iron(III) transport system permease protein